MRGGEGYWGGIGGTLGERGAIIPSLVSCRGFALETLSNDRKEKIERNSDTRVVVVTGIVDPEGDPGSALRVISGAWHSLSKKFNTPVDIGSALSFALRLRNRNSGASQTQMPKKEAISLNPGTLGPSPR